MRRLAQARCPSKSTRSIRLSTPSIWPSRGSEKKLGKTFRKTTDGGFSQEGKGSPHGSSGTARAARSLLRRRLAGAKRIEAVLKPEAAAALADLRQRTGRTYSAIIEGLLLPSMPKT